MASANMKAHRDLKPNAPSQRLQLIEAQLDRGIVRRIVLPMPQKRTQIDPDTAWCEFAMNNAEIVDDVLGLNNQYLSYQV